MCEKAYVRERGGSWVVSMVRWGAPTHAAGRGRTRRISTHHQSHAHARVLTTQVSRARRVPHGAYARRVGGLRRTGVEARSGDRGARWRDERDRASGGPLVPRSLPPSHAGQGKNDRSAAGRGGADGGEGGSWPVTMLCKQAVQSAWVCLCVFMTRPRPRICFRARRQHFNARYCHAGSVSRHRCGSGRAHTAPSLQLDRRPLRPTAGSGHPPNAWLRRQGPPGW